MKTFIIICFISVIFQVFGETLNFKQIFQTPTRRDYDKLEILERSSFGTTDDNDDEQSLSSQQPINDKTKASANAQISLRFGQEKILPCGCRQSVSPCLPSIPPSYPYPPPPPPYCHPYPYPCAPILYSYNYPSLSTPLSSSSTTAQSQLEQVLSDLSKAVSALAERADSTPSVDGSSKDPDTYSADPKDERAPVVVNNVGTFPSEPKDERAPVVVNNVDTFPSEPKDERAPVVVDNVDTFPPQPKDEPAPVVQNGDDDPFPSEPKDECAAVVVDNDDTFPPQPKHEPAPVVENGDDEPTPVMPEVPLQPAVDPPVEATIVEKEIVKITDIVDDNQIEPQPTVQQPTSTIKFVPITLPCPPRPEKTEMILKEQLNNALIPHFSRNTPDLLLTYPIFNPKHYETIESSISTSGSQRQYSDPSKTVIINEPMVTKQVDRVVIPLTEMASMQRPVQRPLPLPFPDPAPFIPLPDIITITKPVIWHKPVVPTTTCPCRFCTQYTKELNE